ncbi:MAG TPA: hypothetical protein VK308_05660, partial [Pyrinomonadaceae bacterium]|nr:hypothetical protein [Pyrinomonadaceae bacterium]
IKLETKTVPSSSAARGQAVGKFIEKSLEAFAGRKTYTPIVEKVDGKDRTIAWRWFINHFFFIERGSWAAEDLHPEYMALVKRQNGEDTELVTANINFTDSWRILSVDTKTWGENLTADVECSEEAVIRAMIKFLFDREYMIADLKA